MLLGPRMAEEPMGYVARGGRVLLTLAALLPMHGCDSGSGECSLYDVACKGNVALTCGLEYSDDDAPTVWKRVDCGENPCRVVSDEYLGARAVCVDSTCLTDAECPASTPYCDGFHCQPCLFDDDCPAAAGLPHCLLPVTPPDCCVGPACAVPCSPARFCGCELDAECPSELPRCFRGVCVECRTDRDCKTGGCLWLQFRCSTD